VPIREAGAPLIRSMAGLHLYHFFLSNCAQRVSLALAAEDIMRRPAFEPGIRRLQPWYAPVACAALKLKSRIQRGGPPPRRANL